MPETLTVHLHEGCVRNLRVLIGPDTGCTTMAAVLETLADHAQQGVYRPGSWERPWLEQVFGHGWQARLIPDTDPRQLSADGRVIFDRPRSEP